MPKLPERKAGIIACSGEELAEGTVSRLAALEVLQKLRPGNTVTICLPLFLAGGKEDRTFAKFHPTITVDGCHLRCAARATELYSAPPKAGIVVTELARDAGVGPITGCRRLNDAGQHAVAVTAARLASLVDEVLGTRPGAAHGAEAASSPAEVEATCSCGSGVPVRKLVIAGNTVEVIALPPILAELHGRPADDALAHDLLAMVKIYNEVPPEQEAAWTAALLAEHAAEAAKEPR
jgi:hypothetical protein